MLMTNYSNINLTAEIKRVAALPAHFLRDRKGVAAIEFALIAPIMIAFYFGLSEISMGISTDRQVTHATSVAGDLATQVTSMDRADIEDVMTATVAVMGVRSSNRSDITIELNSYQKNADNSIERVGYARVGPQISAGGSASFDPSTLGANMLNASSGVVVARVNYKYKPATLAFMKNTTLAETFLLKPRKSLSVPFDEGGTTDFTCSVNADLSVSC
jgi:Flp pilus assembly protein TadG